MADIEARFNGRVKVLLLLVTVILNGSLGIAGHGESADHYGGVTCFSFKAEAVEALSTPSTVESLKKAYSELPFTDVILEMYYYSRLRGMSHKSEYDIGLLESMPRNETEFWFLYYGVTSHGLSAPGNVQHFSELNNLYLQYYDTLSDLVISHPAYLRRFLLQAYFANGDPSDSLYVDIAKLQKAIPKEFWSAYKKLPLAVKQKLCLDCKDPDRSMHSSS
jgi:hypothetical protein